MKKTLAVLIAALALCGVVLTGCAPKTEDAADTTTDSAVAGGYSEERDVTDEDMEIFNEAMEGMAGASYEPLKVSTQVVAGTNYKFYCKMTLVTSTPTEGYAYVTIFDPLSEDEVATITDVEEVDG